MISLEVCLCPLGVSVPSVVLCLPLSGSLSLIFLYLCSPLPECLPPLFGSLHLGSQLSLSEAQFTHLKVGTVTSASQDCSWT